MTKLSFRPGFLVATALTAGLMALAIGSPAEAGPLTLQMSSGGTTITTADGGIGDVNGGAGAVTFIGSVGNFSTNVVTGTAVPALSPPSPHLDLNSVDVASAAGGTLVIKLSQTDFNSTDALLKFLTSWGGTISDQIPDPNSCPGCSVDLDVYVNLDNGLFSTTGTQVADFNFLNEGVFGNTNLANAAVDDAFSVTIVSTINLPNGGTFSRDAEVMVMAVPEPMTLGLMGAALCFAGLFARRRQAT